MTLMEKYFCQNLDQIKGVKKFAKKLVKTMFKTCNDGNPVIRDVGIIFLSEIQAII